MLDFFLRLVKVSLLQMYGIWWMFLVLLKYLPVRWKNSSRNSEGRRFWIKGSAVSAPPGLQAANIRPKSSTKAVRVGVLGASGYTGAEVHFFLISSSMLKPHDKVCFLVAVHC